MITKKPVCLSSLIVGFSLLIMVPALFSLVALPTQNARACDGVGDHKTGFVLQAPIDSTWTTASCPTISVLGLSINTINAIFGGEDYDNSLHCDTLSAGQVVRVTFASDVTSGTPAQLTATSVTLPWDDSQGNVFVSGAIQSVTANSSATPPTTSVAILGLAIDVTSASLMSNDDIPLTLAFLAALTPGQLAEGQFANVVATASTATPPALTATSLFLHLLETKVAAPLDSNAVCPSPTSSASTISVLGQTIDISTAIFEGGNGGTFTCSDLQAGQWVKVTLNDATLSASELEMIGAGCGRFEDGSNVKVIAPVLYMGTTGLPYMVGVLGANSPGVITVDISNAWIVDEDGQPIAVGQLMPWQFVKMTLTSNVPAATAPQFVASVVKSLAPGSVVDFDVFDEHGNEVNDGRNDVSAGVTFAYAGKGAARTVTLHTTSSGKFSVANMPQGQANVVVTRVNGGQKSMAANKVNVARKTTKNVCVVLKPVTH
jgi:hypothetical protein